MHIFWRYLYRNGSICKVMTVARGVTIMLYFLFLPFLSIVSRMQTFDFLFIVQALPFFCYCIFYQVGLSFSSRKKSLSGGTITSISLLSSTRFCSPSSSTHSLSHSLSFFPDSVRLVYLFHSLLPVYQYYHNYYDWPSNLKTDSEE